MKNKDRYLQIVCFVLFLLFSLRDYSVGADTENYMQLFNNAEISVREYILSFPSLSFFIGDPLFFFYCYGIKSLGLGERSFIVISSFIMIWSTYRFIKKYSQNYLISLLSFMTIGLMSMYMSGIRQSIALSIASIAIQYIIEEKPIKYYVCVLLSAGFHSTAYIMLPVYLVMLFLKKKNPKIVITTCILLGAISTNLFYQIIGKLDLGIRFTAHLIDPVKTNPLLLMMYLAIAIICVVYRYGNKSKEANETKKANDILFVLYSIGIAIVILSLQNTMISRFSSYFMIGLPVLLSNSISSPQNVQNRLILNIVCIVIEVVFFAYTVPNSNFEIAKYMFFWQ